MSNGALALVQSGLRLHRAGQIERAAELYERALGLDPTSFDALQLLALIRFRGGQLQAGIDLFERALARGPRHASTWNNYGNALLASGRWADACAAYQAAIANTTQPPAVIFRNLGIALLESGREVDAKVALEESLKRDPADFDSLRRLADLAFKHRDWARAEPLLSRLLAWQPNLADRLIRQTCRQHLALWDAWDDEISALTAAEPIEHAQVDPHKLMFLVDSPVLIRRYAEAFQAFGRSQNTLSPPAAYRTRAPYGRISIGYLSSDIRRHPVSQLLAGVLESRDPRRFEITVHARGPDCKDPERTRIREACDHFVLHDQFSGADSVRAIREFNHDILIDLMGYTQDAKPGIFFERPARMQIGWLGYPGTMGAGLLDAVIADDYVIPPAYEAHYAEPILRMPHCYLPADRSRQVNPARPREAYGFADDDVIMACFCQLQKITPIVFDLWMETMAAAPSLVLWLFDAQAAVAERLRQRAAARGVDASRIRFAEFVPDHADHLARYAVADFAVDTFPYGSHTTAIDALWVGCPLIAWSGEGFASRVSGSVLRAGGCPELIANSADEYRGLILTLANDPLRRRSVRQELLLKRTSSPLFDVAQFTRHYEALLSKIAGQGASGFPFSASPGP